MKYNWSTFFVALGNAIAAGRSIDFDALEEAQEFNLRRGVKLRYEIWVQDIGRERESFEEWACRHRDAGDLRLEVPIDGRMARVVDSQYRVYKSQGSLSVTMMEQEASEPFVPVPSVASQRTALESLLVELSQYAQAAGEEIFAPRFDSARRCLETTSDLPGLRPPSAEALMVTLNAVSRIYGDERDPNAWKFIMCNSSTELDARWWSLREQCVRAVASGICPEDV